MYTRPPWCEETFEGEYSSGPQTPRRGVRVFGEGGYGRIISVRPYIRLYGVIK